MATWEPWKLSSGATGARGSLYASSSYFGQGVGLLAASGSAHQASPSITYSAPIAPIATPVSPTFDPKIEANQLYGKPMALFTGGYAPVGASPAPIVGPYINGDIVEFIVSFGVPSNPAGNRKIYHIWLDNELAWSSVSGGTLPGDGTFANEAFDFVFKEGRLDQTACSLESEKFPGDECAYRPQMILQIRNLPWARFMANSGRPVPYVACDIGDVTDAAVPQDGINLGEALERVAHSPWAGGTSSTFEAVGITDVVDAILIKDNFTIIQLCQSVTREYRNIDLLVSDKIRVKDRGANVAPDFIFDRDTIVSDDEAIAVTRAGATAQRREHELIAIDPDQDYTAVPSLSQIPRNPMVISAAVGKETTTLPLVIDASTRQALATFSQNYEENARRKVALRVLARGYQIEPGDLYALSSIANGFDNEVFKCTSTSHGANWMVELEGEAILRCSIYSEPVVGGTTWDAATAHNVTLSNGNLTVRSELALETDQGARCADIYGRSSGKYYIEISATTIHHAWSAYHGVGIGTTTSTYLGMGPGHGVVGVHVVRNNGEIYANGTEVATLGGMSSFSPMVALAVDLDHRKIWIMKFESDVPASDWNGDASADPASNIGGITIPAGTMVPFCTFGGTRFGTGAEGDEWTANFGASPFIGVVPSGFMPGW